MWVTSARANPNVANLLPAKTAKLAPENTICALARSRNSRTVKYAFVLSETARGHIPTN